jgi:hypothetical protein
MFAPAALHGATTDWDDWGLLDVPDPAFKQLTTQQKTFRDFIAHAYPDYAFHTWANKLIALLEQIAAGTLNRLIVTIPPRTGKSVTPLVFARLLLIPLNLLMPIPVRRDTITYQQIINYQKIVLLLVTGLHQIAVVVLQQVYADHLQVKDMHLE